MYPYFILLFIIIIISILKKYISDNLYLIIIFSIMGIFIALKDYSYFSDQLYYEKMFNFICKNGLIKGLHNYSLERGYIIYNYLISLFTKKYFVFLIITAFISLIGPYLFIKDNSKDYFISILLYLVLLFGKNFYILRSSIALSIVFIAMKFLKEKKLIPYILLILLAGCFHKTILVFLPLYFLLHIDYDKKKLYILLSLAILLFLFKGVAVSLIISRFYDYYLKLFFEKGGYKLLFCLIVIFGYTLYNKKTLIKKDGNNNIFINMLMYSIFFQILATELGPINRITVYLLSSLLVLVPELLNVINNEKYNKIIRLCFSFMLILLFILKVINGQPFFEYHIYGL